jgi:hypothetical protein
MKCGPHNEVPNNMKVEVPTEVPERIDSREASVGFHGGCLERPKIQFLWDVEWADMSNEPERVNLFT